MITSYTIGNILYRDCKAFGISVLPAGKTLEGIPTADTIVIHTKEQIPEQYFTKSIPEVNIFVPDLAENTLNSKVGEYEKQAQKLFREYVCGEYDGTPYRYSFQSTRIESDTEKKCHYVNVKVLFEVLNTK
jgi:hypothetical protein